MAAWRSRASASAAALFERFQTSSGPVRVTMAVGDVQANVRVEPFAG